MSNRLIIDGKDRYFGRHVCLIGGGAKHNVHTHDKQESGPLDTIKPKVEDVAEEARKRKAQEDACLPGTLVKKKSREKRNTIKFVL